MSSQILKYKDAYFYSYIKSLIKEYATKHQDRILMKYVNSDSLKIDEILNIKVIEMLDILAIVLGLVEVSFVVWLVVKNLYIKGDR